MRILAIDFGSKRVGLALSDPEGLLASPHKTLPNEGKKKLLEAVVSEVSATGPDRVLVGIPYRTDGSLHQEARRVLKFALALQTAIDIPVTSIDEAFTTSEALARLRQMGGKRNPKKDRVFIDQFAAVLLLEEYLRDLPDEAARLPTLPPFESQEAE